MFKPAESMSSQKRLGKETLSGHEYRFTEDMPVGDGSRRSPGRQNMKALRTWVGARPPLRRLLRPLILVRRLVMRFGRDRQRRRIEAQYSRVLEGSVVFCMPEFNGAYEVDIRSDLAKRIMFDGAYEPEFASLCAVLVDPGMDALDIGANVGMFTGLIASHLNDGRRVASLEPTAGAHRLLLRNIDRNRLGSRVLALQMAASNRDGRHEIRFCPGREEYSSCGPVVHPAMGGELTERCPVPGTTIDGLCRQHELEPGFIKIDVEGYEYNVLLGAERVIRQYRPTILAEVSDSMLRSCGASSSMLISWLTERGYQVRNAACPSAKASGDFDGEVVAEPNGCARRTWSRAPLPRRPSA